MAVERLPILTKCLWQQLMKYMNLDQRGKVQAEYVWIDAHGGCRSKTKVCLYHRLVRPGAIGLDPCPIDHLLHVTLHLHPPAHVTNRIPSLHRLSPSPSSPSTNSPSGTSTARQRPRPPVTTPMSTCAPSPSSPIPSVSVTTSSSSVRPGIPMEPPTSSTTAMMPTV